MSKHLAPLILSAALLAATAQSQESGSEPPAKGTCAVLDGLVSSAQERFERYRGDQVGPNLYEAAIVVSGFPSCSVVLADIDMYVCLRPGRFEREAQALYELALAKMRGCIPDWEEAEFIEAIVPGVELMQGQRFIKTVASGEIGMGIAHIRERRGEAVEDAVALTVVMRRSANPTS